MTFNPDNITKDHVLNAIKTIKETSPVLTNGNKWEVIIDGIGYPPKEVMRYARKEYDGSYDWPKGGGWPTNDYLIEMGFEVREKNNDAIDSLIKKYKKHIKNTQLKDEVYKWVHIEKYRGRPNLETNDLLQEVKSVDYSNLLYAMSKAVLYHLIGEKPDEMRTLLLNLFNESEQLSTRIKAFNEDTLSLYRSIGQTLQHHQDERTISTYLTFYDPEKYTFYKDSFYKKYCILIGVKPQKVGQKLTHYYELIDELIEDYILKDSELIELVNQYLPENSFKDQNHRILAQDILYQMLDKGIDEIEIGNSNIYKISMGDFSDNEVEDCIKRKIVCVHKDTRAKGISIETQGNLFENGIKEGDFFYLTQGNGDNKIKLLGKFIGTAKPSSFYDANDGWLDRSFEIITTSVNKKKYSGENKWWTPNNNSTCIQIKKPEINVANKLIFEEYFRTRFISSSNEIFEEKETNNSNEIINEMKSPLNQILYGPPGTGKTFNTINKAISIVNPDFDLSQGRELIKVEYDRLVKAGQILFTTFHQSMSYEDFIEGIKPKIDEGDDETKQVYYEVENGIFKRLVEQAKKVRTTSSVQIEPYSFEDGWNDLVADANKHLEENNPLFLSIQTPNLGLKIVEVTERGNLNLKPVYSEASKEYTVSYTRTKKLQEAFPDLTVVRNIDKEFRAVMGGSNSTAYWAVLNYINQRINEKTKVISQDVVLPSLPYVLIIDEINRGNVSQIFGELITLIEDDKRLGKDEALEVILPYSKEKFGVPSNLHIIGTMNTADRSVEALDTALRRRFSFEEMPPKPELIASEGKLKNSNGEINGINLVGLLKIINKRIEKLIDKDHQIGHSYFISVASLEDLKHSFQNKIIPLLQEYFFGDYGKIGLVLGKGFFEEPITENSDLFTSFYDYDGSEFEDRSIYHLKNIDKMQDADFINAIHTLLSGK